MPGNKLFPVLAALLVAGVFLIGLRSCARHKTPAPQTLGEIPRAPRPDADSPADTLRALTAQVAAARSEMEKLRRENEELLRQRQEMESRIENNLAARMQSEHQKTKDETLSELNKRLREIGKLVAPPASGDIPPGLGLSQAPAFPELVWVEPLGGGKGLLDKTKGMAQKVSSQGAELLSHGQSLLDNPILTHGGGKERPAAKPDEPVYTVPRNATLIGSTAMTALIGRIPIRGQVTDPFPFKIIVGSDNLAANGLEIPGVDGMVFSGTAFGDWTLSCVRGTVHSVTFVFEDGTIRTLSSDDQSLQQKSARSARERGEPGVTSNQNRPLGWISDRRGIPCITGKRITNAAQYLGGRILARGVEAAGEAYARSQTTVTATPLGGFQSTVTGEPGKYALGKVGAEAADEIARWIEERQSQSFDAVFVDTGVEVAVHVDQELPIDYEPRGRRLVYAKGEQTRLVGPDGDLD